MENGKDSSAFGNERRRTSPHWAVLSFWCPLSNPSVSFADSSLYTREPWALPHQCRPLRILRPLLVKWKMLSEAIRLHSRLKKKRPPQSESFAAGIF